jgi:septal ring factor EnvC (AmiA/AmiB activator)
LGNFSVEIFTHFCSVICLFVDYTVFLAILFDLPIEGKFHRSSNKKVFMKDSREKESYKSPQRKLIKFFEKSRDQWKAKCLVSKQELKRLKNRIRFLEKSKAHWKDRAKELEAELSHMKLKQEELEKELEEKKRLERQSI